MPVLAFSPNADLSQGFTAAQVAEKHGWPEPMVWSMALDGKDDRKDFRNFSGVLESGINGSSMIVTKDLEMNGPDASRPRWQPIFYFIFQGRRI